MANLKDIVATLAILSAGTLTLTGCEKSGAETTTPDAAAGEAAGEATPAEGEASCSGEADAEGEASCSGEADAEGEASCSGEADGEADGEASCSGAA
jgi:hypothetical protein